MSVKKYLLVNVDTNDADYVEGLTPITDEHLDILRPFFEAIRQFKPYPGKGPSGMTHTHRHNFPCGEMFREDLGEKSPDELYPYHAYALELFQDNYLPSTEYGCHTIESIRVLTVTADEEII